MLNSKSISVVFAGAILFLGAAHATTLATCTLLNQTTSDPDSCITYAPGRSSYVEAQASGPNVSAVGATEFVESAGNIGAVVALSGESNAFAISATGDVTAYFYSSGPLRSGDITITNFSQNHSGMANVGSNASVVVTDGVHTYTFGIVCSTQTSCGVLPTATFAFNLGSSFSVEETFDDSYINYDPARGDVFNDLDGAYISFSLSDANGNPVAVTLAPEPATFALFGLASLPLGLWMIRRKQVAGKTDRPNFAKLGQNREIGLLAVPFRNHSVES